MSSKKRPGVIYELKDGRHAIAYHDEQEQVFRDQKKIFMHTYQPFDSADLQRVDQQVQAAIQADTKGVLKHVDTIKARIGFFD